VRALGGNALASRRRGLSGRKLGERLDAALEAHRSSDGRYPLSFEIVYGHAWKGQPKTASDGRAIVRFEPPATPRRKRSGRPGRA
jgi:malonyl-CoA O-methyltransferase